MNEKKWKVKNIIFTSFILYLTRTVTTNTNTTDKTSSKKTTKSTEK
jgi:hypothetical protein